VVRQIRFSGPVIWGPEAVGDQLVAATADGHIHCLSAEGREQWQLEWDYGPLLAVLPTDDHTWYVLSCRGRVAAVDAATGARLGEPLALGHDLIGAPVFVATRRKWLLTGSGGTLWWFQPPPRAGAARPSDSNAE
jgi:outer membrane protein assembly factor BamB